MPFVSSVEQYIDTLLHPSARMDAMTRARHRAFIAPRLFGAFGALVTFPLYLAWRGAPTAIEVMLFAWLIVPILLAYYLSRTGHYKSAHVLSSLALASLVLSIAYKTGGIESFIAVWLVVVPLEASLSGSRRVVTAATALALVTTGLLLGIGAAGLLPESEVAAYGQSPLMAFGIISAALYGAGLAYGSEVLSRTNFWLLYAEEDRYRLLANHMSDVITRHGPNGEVLFMSPTVEAMLGVPPDELKGHGLFERVHVADRPAFLTALSGMPAGDDEPRTVAFRVRKGRSEPETDDPRATRTPPEFIWVEMRCRTVESAQMSERDPGGVVAVMRDITERVQQEQQLVAARAEAEHANAAKGRFLATMSHELRTPLNAIIGFSEMIARDEDIALPAEKRHEYAQLIHESGQHLLSVVNDILEMSKIDAGCVELAPVPFHPGELVRNCCDLMALRAREAGLDIAVNIADALPRMTGDRRAVKQIMLNLLSNAIKFTDRGGTITVRVAATASTIVLRVEDTGIGMASEDLSRLGEAFFQADKTYNRRHDGTGLGVSIVKGLVALHQGEVVYESRLHEGTQVTVMLPIEFQHGVPQASPRPVTATVRALHGGKGRGDDAVADDRAAASASATGPKPIARRSASA